MNQAKTGDKVKVHYTGKLENGKVFGTSKEGQPLEFEIGTESVLPALERGIIGMGAGDAKAIEVQPEEAFGLRHEELVVEVKKTEFPENMTPSVGEQLQIKQDDGNLIDVMITDIGEDSVTLDANHPLAGNRLFFDIELLEIT